MNKDMIELTATTSSQVLGKPLPQDLPIYYKRSTLTEPSGIVGDLKL